MSRALALVDRSDDVPQQDAADAASERLQLLETKLYIPRARTRVVPRPRLTSAIGAQDGQRLTVVSAPAGFGKTTLLAEWLAQPGLGAKAAWVSLDASENDLRLFWAYVIRAFQKAGAAVGMHAASLLQSSPGPRIERVVAALINDIAATDADWLLVLDDYHVIEDRGVHETLTFLLDHLPPRMRVVIASRSEPPLALPRLRARGELTEVRVADMRFTPGEASTFFTQVMALDLSPTQVRTLEHRTEGWIAGLKLAAMSMQGRGDAASFVNAFSGDNRHVADYLVQEALESEPPDVRRFLLATSILDRLTGSLCDAVTGIAGSQAVLEDLERRNLFVVALDDRREWFRYHHLFADVLQKQSSTRDPLAAREAHQRASDWHDARGNLTDAVRHALAADNVERAADLLERRWPEKDRSYESAAWLARVNALPADVVAGRPVLMMGYAWALLNNGELEASDARMRDVERMLESDRARLRIADAARFETLPAELASARIYLAQSRGDIPGTLEHAVRSLEGIPHDDHAARATGIALVALAHWGRGELDPAHDTFAKALEEMGLAGHDLDVIRGTFVLGDVRAAQGRLSEAVEIYERGLALAGGSPRHANAETDELHLGLSEIHRERNDLARAMHHLDAIGWTNRTVAHSGNRQRWCVDRARVHEARGELDRALELLDEAERSERRDPIPRTRPIPALRARIHLAQGNTAAAARWAAHAGVTTNDSPSFLRELEHVTLARLMIAQRRSITDVVLPFVDRLHMAARAGGRLGSAIELLVVQALAHHALGNQRASLDALTDALTLAEPQGFLRVFLDEGTVMRDLLRTATARGLGGGYTRHVLAAFDAPERAIVTQTTPSVAASTGDVPTLTARELEILRLIAAGLRNAEIAEHLSISAATVKRHIANTYGKLNVEHRTEALARATTLKLL